MGIVDRDLVSIQEMRDLINRAVAAQKELAALGQEEVDRITQVMVLAGIKAAGSLAELAVEETGLGIVKDKETKNLVATESLYE
ncbi:MAG: acetaldehyde dehydrogenase [Thermoanaerobacter thermocopriae]|jgi:acyl-CoA reductase-like NAD-dependent aldehyde dehydrogenase|nr:MAG: acetaldehyde dehydrogenase [Thermoanaerobacter thermocopriae]